MITRSGRKKNCSPMPDVTPLSSLNKKTAKINSAKEIKRFSKSPVVEDSNERNTQNVQSPVFNIHVHMPSIPNDLNESCQVQPVIHLHFGDVMKRLSSGSTSQHADTGKSFKVESLSELNNNCEEQNNSHEEIVEISDKNKTCKRLSFEDLNGENGDLATEESEVVLVTNDSLKGNELSKKAQLHKSKPPVRKKTSVKKKKDEQKENGDFSSNAVFESGSPLRRSTRVANNLKLLETIKAISVKQSKSRKHKSKKFCKTAKYKNKSGQILNPFTLKEPMVVLCDKCRVHDNDKKENITGCNSTDSVSVDVEDNTSLAEENACEKNPGSVNESCSSSIDTEIYEKQYSSDGGGPSDDEENEIQNGGLAYESSTDVDDTEKLNMNSNYESSSKNEDTEEDKNKTLINESSSESEENKTVVKKGSSDESLLSLGRKSGEVYSAIYTSDNEETCAEKNSSDVEENSVRENYMSTTSSVESSASDSCVQGKENIQPNELMITNEVENDHSDVLPNKADQLLHVESGTENDGAVCSNGSSISGNLETDLDEVDSDLSDRADAEDDEQTPVEEERDLDNGHLESESNNSFKNVGDECLSKSDDYEEISKACPSFQLELFKKDMKTRKMTYEERSSKSALKKKKLSQISEKEPDNSPLAKKIKLTNGAEASPKKTTKKSTKESPGDFIPLQVSGPTKFAVARLNSLKAHEHKAKNFKAEMLFGKRVARFSDSNHLQTYKLKKQAAAKRKKMSK